MDNSAPVFPQVINACIYCGSSNGPLSDEHVVPFGLGGSWKLLKASCHVHRDLTSAIELEVLHHALGTARAAAGIRSRRKTLRPALLPIKFQIADVPQLVELPAGSHPATFYFPIFARPGVTPDDALLPDAPVEEVMLFGRPKALEAFALAHGADAITTSYPDPLAFARFLAKVAHGFAVACDGLDACLATPLLEALLAGDSSIYHFVGNDPSSGPHTAGAGRHDISLRHEKDTRIVFLRILACYGTPEYVVRLDAPGAA